MQYSVECTYNTESDLTGAAYLSLCVIQYNTIRIKEECACEMQSMKKEDGKYTHSLEAW